MGTKYNNQINVPQAREAMDCFTMLISQEVGVNLRSGYNASLTSRETGDLGGQMVSPIRNMKFERNNRILAGHVQKVKYIATIMVKFCCIFSFEYAAVLLYVPNSRHTVSRIELVVPSSADSDCRRKGAGISHQEIPHILSGLQEMQAAFIIKYQY